MNHTHLIISLPTELFRIYAGHILYIMAEGNYSQVYLTDGHSRMFTIQLGQIVQLIADQLDPQIAQMFGRIGKSLVVNMNYIYWINITKQEIVLKDPSQAVYTVKASKEALKQLKEAIEKGI